MAALRVFVSLWQGCSRMRASRKARQGAKIFFTSKKMTANNYELLF